MDQDDQRWSGLLGGYRAPYDPRPAIAKLAAGDETSAWAELWQELHHQGDVGEASYAAIPALVRIYAQRKEADWNTYAFAATVEEARHNVSNPAIPEWLRGDYDAAWHDLFALGLAELPGATSSELIDSIIAVLAFRKGRPTIGRMAMLTEDERQEMLEGSEWG
jgi:hypothetical protein